MERQRTNLCWVYIELVLQLAASCKADTLLVLGGELFLAVQRVAAARICPVAWKCDLGTCGYDRERLQGDQDLLIRSLLKQQLALRVEKEYTNDHQHLMETAAK